MEELQLVNWETGARPVKAEKAEDNCSSSSLDLEYGRTSSHSQLTGLETRDTSTASLAEATPRVVNLAPQELLFYGESLAQVHRWKVLEKLGQGSYGVVRKAVNVDTGEVAAMKIMNLSTLKDVERMRIRREIDVQSRLKHSKVISVLQVFEAPESRGSLIFILMELHDGQDLFRHLKHLNRSRLKERQAKELFVQMLSAVHYCHTSSVVHRDIKLENFLYNETTGEIKLCDFGLCNTWASSSSSSSSLSKSPEGFFSTFVGSPVYMAPEIVKKKQNYSGPAVDVWALGVVLYSLLVGSQPFVTNGTLVVQRLLLGSCHYPRFLSKESKSLLQSMLNPDATRRITSSQILQHPWIHSTVIRSSNLFSYLPTLPSPQSSSSLSTGSKKKKTKSSFFSCIS